MGCDHFQLLRQVALLANAPSCEAPTRLRNILELVSESLDVGASLWFFDGDQSRCFLCVSPEGPDLLYPSCEDLPWREVFSQRSPLSSGACLYLPVFHANRNLAILCLDGTSEGSGSAVPGLWDALCAQIAPLVSSFVLAHEEGRAGKDGTTNLREISTLYKISLAMHGISSLDELFHFLLSAITTEGGGGFEQALLFTVNQRSGVFQGMLAVNRQSAALVLPSDKQGPRWRDHVLTEQVRSAQRQIPLCRWVIKQRFPIERRDSPLVNAIVSKELVFISDPQVQDNKELYSQIGDGPYACVPLLGRERPLGVLVVQGGAGLTSGRLRFLKLFSQLAAQAVEKAMLLHRLEGAHQDLRETEELLAQGEKMAILGSMAATVAHEIKNPLVSIGGFARRLVKTLECDTKEQGYASIIAKEVSRMENLLGDVLTFSKKPQLSFSPCNVSEVVEEALDLQRDNLREGNIQVTVDILEKLPSIRGDSQKLMQVILNLISNACQVMEEGGLLTLRTELSSLRGDPAVAVHVQDTGGGVPPGIIGNIFNPFFSTKEKGTGLGLAVSQRIVEMHRGLIDVVNTGDGAVFTLRIPIVPGEQSP